MSDPLLKSDPRDPGVESRTLNVLIATPAYGGVTFVLYNQALRWLMATFQRYGIRHQISETTTESLIPRARNAFGNVVAFDKDPFGNDYTHLLFIDADISFHPDNIIQMLGFNRDITALPYPCKDIDWTKIVTAVKKGVTDPTALSRMGSRPIINTNGEQINFDTGKPVEFPQLGTGCLLIKREVFLKFAEDPERRYNLMQGEMHFGTRKHAYEFFRIGVNPETRFYDSEDYRFCLDAHKLGFKTWMLPWAVTNHTGNMTFTMDMPTQAFFGIPSGPMPAPDSGAQVISIPVSGGIVPLTDPLLSVHA